MSTRMHTVLQLAVTAVAVFCAQAAKGPTCAFEPNNEAPENLTCTFETDLKQEKHGFSVQRYCFKNGIEPVIVLYCAWSEDLGLTCKVTPGYTFNASTVVSNRIALGFQYLTKNIEGNYKCQLVPQDPNGAEDNETCTYKHDDAPEKTHCAFEPNDQTPEKLICTFAVDLRRTKHDFNVQRHGLEENKDSTIVLSCIWDKDVLEPRCYVAHGYTFDNNTISNKIVLGIQKSATEAEGRYMCQLIPPVCEDECIHTCKNKDVANTRCAFEPNNEAPEKLTCKCDVDSGQMKHNVSVLVFRYGKAPANVLSCNWKEGNLTYHVDKRYTFNNSTICSKIVLGIQNLTRDPEDVYRCQVILPLGEDESNETCPPKHHGNNHADNNGKDKASLGKQIGIGIVVSIAVIVIALVIYWCCCKRKRAFCEKSNQPSGTKEERVKLDQTNTQKSSSPHCVDD